MPKLSDRARKVLFSLIVKIFKQDGSTNMKSLEAITK